MSDVTSNSASNSELVPAQGHSPLGREKMRECIEVSSNTLERGEKAVQQAREMEGINREMRRILQMDKWTPKLDTGNST